MFLLLSESCVEGERIVDCVRGAGSGVLDVVVENEKKKAITIQTYVNLS